MEDNGNDDDDNDNDGTALISKFHDDIEKKESKHVDLSPSNVENKTASFLLRRSNSLNTLSGLRRNRRRSSTEPPEADSAWARTKLQHHNPAFHRSLRPHQRPTKSLKNLDAMNGTLESKTESAKTLPNHRFPPNLPRKCYRSRSLGDAADRRSSIFDAMDSFLPRSGSCPDQETKGFDLPMISNKSPETVAPARANPTLDTFFRKIDYSKEKPDKTLMSTKSESRGILSGRRQIPGTFSLSGSTHDRLGHRSILKNADDNNSSFGSITSNSSIDSEESGSEASNYIEDLNEVAGMMLHDLSRYIQQKEEEMDAVKNLSFPKLSIENEDDDDRKGGRGEDHTSPPSFSTGQLSGDYVKCTSLHSVESNWERLDKDKQALRGSHSFSQLVVGAMGTVEVEEFNCKAFLEQHSRPTENKKSKKLPKTDRKYAGTTREKRRRNRRKQNAQRIKVVVVVQPIPTTSKRRAATSQNRNRIAVPA